MRGNAVWVSSMLVVRVTHALHGGENLPRPGVIPDLYSQRRSDCSTFYTSYHNTSIRTAHWCATGLPLTSEAQLWQPPTVGGRGQATGAPRGLASASTLLTRCADSQIWHIIYITIGPYTLSTARASAELTLSPCLRRALARMASPWAAAASSFPARAARKTLPRGRPLMCLRRWLGGWVGGTSMFTEEPV